MRKSTLFTFLLALAMTIPAGAQQLKLRKLSGLTAW